MTAHTCGREFTDWNSKEHLLGAHRFRASKMGGALRRAAARNKPIAALASCHQSHSKDQGAIKNSQSISDPRGGSMAHAEIDSSPHLRIVSSKD
jgi:hypothetical protein